MGAEVWAEAERWSRRGPGVCVAFVTRTWGSSPRPVGSALVINEAGEFAGSVSGGCVEPSVVQAAPGVLRGEGPRRLEFGVSTEEAWQAGLSCGGRLEICLQRLGPEACALLAACERGARARSGAVVTLDLGRGEVQILDIEGKGAQADAGRVALRRGTDVLIEDGDADHLLLVFAPPVRLFAVGAVHISQALAQLARGLALDLTVVDPRAAFASHARFGEVRLQHGWPDEVLEAAELDARSAVMTFSHDPKLDEPALQVALASPAFYVGALGSKRTHASRLERLRAAGVSEERLGRIHGPIGLDLGGRGPAEIALSALAQMTSVFHGGSA